MRLGRHRGKFCAVWYEDGKRQRRSLGTSDPDEAKRRLAEFESIRNRAGTPTVGEIFQDYAARKHNPRIDYAGKSLVLLLGGLEPRHVSETVCSSYAESRRAQGVSDGTIHTELVYLSAALKLACRAGAIDSAPHIWKPRKPRPKDRRLSRIEAKELLGAATMPHVRLVITLMLGTAARVGALLDLTWTRVDFERGLIYLDNPSREETIKRRATIPMNDMVRTALTEAREGALSTHVIEWAGKPVKSIKKGFRRACERADLKDVTPHTLRHTAATWMAEAGVPMDEIAQYLGHSDSRTTYKVYARYSPDYLRKASKALEH